MNELEVLREKEKWAKAKRMVSLSLIMKEIKKWQKEEGWKWR